MRWSRHHTDTSLGELLNAQPDAEDTAVRTAVGPPDPSTTPVEAVETDEQATEENAGFLDDEDYLPQERRGPGRLTVALVTALVLAVGVLGGVWVEKQLGTSQSSAAGGQGFPGGSAGGQGVPGGSAGGQGMPGGTASSAAGSRPSTGSGSGTSTTPVVVGAVSSTSAKSLVVTDLGGTKHTVTVSSSTTVTTPYGHGSLETGDTVAVAGRTASDGSVTATAVTVS